MRLNINLATHKYEDARAFFLRWGLAVALAAIATLVLTGLAWSSHVRAVETSKRIIKLQQQAAELDNERAKAEKILNEPENRPVRDQSRFWNARIEQRAFSWTQLFSDLEKIMPSRAFVTSVEPIPSKDKKLKLKITIDSDSHKSANDLVKSMEASQRFHAASITAEVARAATKSSPALVEFHIETYYTPTAPIVKSAAMEKEGA
jgi:Tfp pilus assembly protein PilN